MSLLEKFCLILKAKQSVEERKQNTGEERGEPDWEKKTGLGHCGVNGLWFPLKLC